MVNCKNCGAPLSLDHAFCPHCGTANPEAQEHLAKLKQLDQDYKKTKFEVLSEVKKNKKGYGVLTILIVILLANLLMIPFFGNSYRIADNIVSSKKPVKEVKEQLNIYLDNKEYEEFVTYYEKYDANYRNYSEYNRFYYLASTYSRVKRNVSNYYFGKDLYADALVRSCNSIKEFKDDYDRYVGYGEENNISLEYYNQLNEEFDLFIKTFLNLNDEDIDSISSISESDLLVLVSKRLNGDE